jgi:hypothetical protein
MPSPIERDVITDLFSSCLRTDRKKQHVNDLAPVMCQQTILEAQPYLLDDVAFNAFEQTIEANPARSNIRLHQLKARPKRWS